MSRVKSFEATGEAPNGRLYAGDLNGIQDHYADLVNFLQTVGVGTLQVGDTGLMIVKYGAGELRATGAMRVDGILRGLGGLFAGTFTTTQRNAIPPGSRPYGLMILNTTENRFEWNAGTDAVPNWKSTPTLEDDFSGLDSLQFPIGGVFDWPWHENQLAGSFGLCYGQPVLRTTYPDLNTVASNSGYPHGAGNGSTTFNLPDYRGRSGVGKDNMGGVSANRVSSASGISGGSLGATGGAETVTLTTAQMPSHNHSGSGSGSGSASASHRHEIPLGHTEHVSEGIGSVPNSRYPDTVSEVGFTGFANITLNWSVSVSVSISNTGGGGAHNNMPPSIIVNKAMRLL